MYVVVIPHICKVSTRSDESIILGDQEWRYGLVLCCFRAYLKPFIAAVVPRLCLTGFTFAQPFLIQTTIEYIGESSIDANYGKALIGAYALVFAGIAVSLL